MLIPETDLWIRENCPHWKARKWINIENKINKEPRKVANRSILCFMVYDRPCVLSQKYATCLWSGPRPICCIPNSGLSVNPRPILPLTFYKQFPLTHLASVMSRDNWGKIWKKKQEKKIASMKQSVVFDQYATADIQHGVKSGVCRCPVIFKQRRGIFQQKTQEKKDNKAKNWPAICIHTFTYDTRHIRPKRVKIIIPHAM